MRDEIQGTKDDTHKKKEWEKEEKNEWLWFDVYWNYHVVPIFLVHGNFKYFILNEEWSAPCIGCLWCWYIVCVLFSLLLAFLLSFSVNHYMNSNISLPICFFLFFWRCLMRCNVLDMINNNSESVKKIYSIGQQLCIKYWCLNEAKWN